MPRKSSKKQKTTCPYHKRCPKNCPYWKMGGAFERMRMTNTLQARAMDENLSDRQREKARQELGRRLSARQEHLRQLGLRAQARYTPIGGYRHRRRTRRKSRKSRKRSTRRTRRTRRRTSRKSRKSRKRSTRRTRRKSRRIRRKSRRTRRKSHKRSTRRRRSSKRSYSRRKSKGGKKRSTRRKTCRRTRRRTRRRKSGKKSTRRHKGGYYRGTLSERIRHGLTPTKVLEWKASRAQRRGEGISPEMSRYLSERRHLTDERNRKIKRGLKTAGEMTGEVIRGIGAAGTGLAAGLLLS